MKNSKLMIGGFSLMVIMGTIAKMSFFNGEMNATSNSFTAPSFALYNKVSIGTNDFTVIGSDASTVKLLSDTTVASDKKYNDANGTLTSLPSTYGTLANPILTGNFSIPLESDLTASKTGNALHASIPTVSTNWWLGDASVNNRSKYLTGNNSFIGENIIQDADIVNKACAIKETTEVGVLPTIDETGADKVISNGNFTWKQSASASGTVKLYSDNECKTDTGGLMSISANSDTGSFSLKNGEICLGSVCGATSANMTYYPMGFFYYAVGYDVMTDMNKDLSFTLEPKTCYVSNTKIMTASGKYMNSYMLNTTANTPVSFYTKIDNYVPTQEVLRCPGKVHSAGSAAVRPLLTLPKSAIVLGNTTKRGYTTSSKIEGGIPSSTSNPQYLTLLSSDLGVTLTTGAKGVSGATLKTAVSSDGTITLPITVPTTMESKKYISAVGTTTSGNKVYGVLGEINGTNGTLTLNVENLVNEDTTSITLDLYEEDPGTGNTAYISAPTTITVELIQPQKIAFTTGSPTTSTYGTDVVVTSHLTSTLSEQATSDIEYSIIDGALKVEIVSQSYNSVNGTATATIRPKDGTGTFKLSINKAGDDNVAAASAQTLEITLAKKDIVVQPVKFSKVYKIGEAMPSLASTSEGLVNSDTIPDALVPSLIPMNSSTPAVPDEEGKVKVSGSWKMVYASDILTGLTDFTNKYNVTLQGYDDTHTDYVFEAALNAIPEDWIDITPDANTNGWNKESVIIAPSQIAKNAGYTVIELLDDSEQVTKFGASIEFASETQSLTPTIRLKKGTVLTPKSTTRELKIDSSNPSVNAVVENENTWVSDKKTVTITATDTISGVEEVTAKQGESVYPVTKQSDGSYTFDADKNGSYAITAKDNAGNEITINKSVAKIDAKEIELTLTAQTKPNPPVSQEIKIDRSVGDSGIASFKVEFKENENGTFEVLEELSKDDTSLTYIAGMNGIYKFTIVNGANAIKSESVTITGLTPPLPVTTITAKLSRTGETYLNDTWTSDDVVLELSNANKEIPETDTITWEVSEDNGTTWTPMGDQTSKKVSTSNWLAQRYTFRATSNNGLVDVKEATGRSITVRIDKAKPSTPIIDDEDTYGEDVWFADDVTLQANMTPKDSNIIQTIQYKVGVASAWMDTNDGTYTVVGNGQHVVKFRVLDGAGNISDESAPIYVNINNSKPTIVINLNNDPIKSFINDLTFGFFFKETVNVDIEANFGLDATGKVYYILDQSETPSVPEDGDERWVEGERTSIEPDDKVMIYVKAVSDAGIIARDSSIYSVVVDASKPSITLPENASNWSKETKLALSVLDSLAGIDAKSLSYHIDGGTATSLELSDNKAEITNLPEGEHTINVTVKDYSGNSQTGSTKVKIDKTNPVIGTSTSSQLGWAKEKKISVSASDALSGLADGYPQVKMSDGTSVDIKNITPGNYTYNITKNDTYTITLQDNAGNQATSTYTEGKIDVDAPTLENIYVMDADAWKSSKVVNFHAKDSGSGIKDVVVSYLENEREIVKNVTQGDSDLYWFKATENAIFTIKVTDNAGNVTTEDIEVSQIDPNGIAIKDISNINTWTNARKKVTFKAQAGMSGLADGFPKVQFNYMPVEVIDDENSQYAFLADRIGVYTILIENNAGDGEREELNIQNIDFMQPVIEDISSNHTATSYREPQTITFHAQDYNTSDKATLGSGLAQGYPRVYYLEASKKVNVPIVPDAKDSSTYAFLADKNTTYIVEVMDQVESGLVTEEIVVDHILKPEDITALNVVATSNQKNIASGVWCNSDITFTLRGGLNESILTSYQVAITDGKQPTESDWQNIASPYIVSKEQRGKAYYFRTAPFFANSKVFGPFFVNIDKTKPADVTISLESINTNAFAKFINRLSLGNWMKEEQKVVFTSSDNSSNEKELSIYYQEEKDGKKSEWKKDTGKLQYNNTNLIVHAKAIDLAGNESSTITQKEIKVENEPPRIEGFTHNSSTYIGKKVSYFDDLSGIASAMYRSNDKEETSFPSDTFFKDANTYYFTITDNAGNETTASFQIKALLEIDSITGSEEEKSIIEQVEKEYQAVKDTLAKEDQAYYETWIKDAYDMWNKKQKTIVETEDKTSKVEGVENTVFPPDTTLIVEEVSLDTIPQLPRKAFYSYDVFLKNGSAIIQPNGDVKVYLPYDGSAEPILYEIDEAGNVREIACEWKDRQVIFTTKKLLRYAISNIDQEETKPDTSIDIDSDKDGTPDVNIDVDCDGDADINMDTNNDGFPDINIDTTGDGKANYNVDLDGDKVADLNIGLLHKTWKPDVCKMGSCAKFCTDSYYKPYLNIDTDGDMLADMNVDIDGDGEADLNIDLDRDNIPDLDIDSDGDGKADINIDKNGDGIADYNLLRLNSWKPDKDVEYNKMKYDTMSGLKPMYNVDRDGDGLADENIKDNTGNALILSGQKNQTSVSGAYQPSGNGLNNGMGGAGTGDEVNYTQLCMMFVTSTLLLTYSILKKRKMRNKKLKKYGL